jgi:hypothetical protein
MRSLITHLTAIATLFHLMVGCCGHVCHGHEGDSCQHEVVADQCAHACTHGHDHEGDATGHKHAPTPAPTIDSADADSTLVALAIYQSDQSGPPHECRGCDCVALTDGNSSTSLSMDFLAVAWSAPVIVQMPVMPLRTAWAAGDPPVLAEIEPRLFERLLI